MEVLEQPPFLFDFCLKLPQSSRNKSTGVITQLGISNISLKAEKDQTKKKSSGLFGSRTIVDTVVDITKAKTNRLFSSSNTSADSIISWFGEADFLDNAASFRKEFGNPPIEILPVPPSAAHKDSSANPIQRELQRYAQRCMFDVFISLCKADYVGHDTDASDILAVQAVCQKILELKQQYRNQHGKTDIRSPDELHNLYLRFIPSLPADPQEWTIPLSATYFNALIDELRTKMLAANFRVPKPVVNATKSAELKSLCQVRNVATEHYAKLQEEVALMDRVLGSRSSSQKSTQSLLGKTLFHVGMDSISPQPSTPTVPGPPAASVFYTSQSPAEQTLQRYKGPPTGASNPTFPNPSNLPTRIGPSGLPHPYRADDPSYLSKYPLGF